MEFDKTSWSCPWHSDKICAQNSVRGCGGERGGGDVGLGGGWSRDIMGVSGLCGGGFYSGGVQGMVGVWGGGISGRPSIDRLPKLWLLRCFLCLQ